MTLQEALMVNGKATPIRGGAVYFIKDGILCCRQNSGLELESSLCFNSAMRDDWKPYKEPCKHVPLESFVDGIIFYRDTCSKCTKKIKATGWEV